MKNATKRPFAVACALALACWLTAVAGEHGERGKHGENDQGEDHGYKHGHHSDHGKHFANGHHRFDDQDRVIVESWCRENRESLPVGFRPEDRLTPELETHLRIGNTLDVRLQGLATPLPGNLVKLLPPPPPDLSYFAIGGHLALTDAAHRLHDLLPLRLPPLPPPPPLPH